MNLRKAHDSHKERTVLAAVDLRYTTGMACQTLKLFTHCGNGNTTDKPRYLYLPFSPTVTMTDWVTLINRGMLYPTHKPAVLDAGELEHSLY